MIARYIKKILHFAVGTTPLAKAFVFSAAVHLLALVAMSGVFGTFKMTGPAEAISSVEMFFTAAGDAQASSPQLSAPIAQTEDVDRSADRLREKSFAVPQTTTGAREHWANEERRTLYMEEEEGGASERFSSPIPLDDFAGEIDFDALNFHSEHKSNRIAMPRVKVRHPELVPAKVAMPKAQQILLKTKLTKIAENWSSESTSVDSVSWREKDRTYTARIHYAAAATDTDLDEVSAEVSTQRDEHTLTTTVNMRRLAFSSYAQLIDYWDPTVAVHNDIFNGRVHTNTTLTLSGSKGIVPKFHGKVTTASYEVKTGVHFPFFDQGSVFLGGFERGAKEIKFPRPQLSMREEVTFSEDGKVHFLREETWLHFYGDGSYAWRTASDRSPVRKWYGETQFFLGDDITIHVQGVVNGKVLVYSRGDIVVEKSVIYAQNPDVFPNSDDYLGLVSLREVKIAPPERTGPGDLHLHAAIFAKERFRVSQLYEGGNAVLYIFGSLSAGSLTATEPRYATRVVFDERLQKSRPPRFPMTDRVEIVDWDRQWQVRPSR